MKMKPPVTRAELANIDGMGESRVNISGEAILATIYAFLEVTTSPLCVYTSQR